MPYLREIESFAGNRTADRVCEQCPEIVTGLLGLKRTYSLDGVVCNATDELICMMIPDSIVLIADVYHCPMKK